MLSKNAAKSISERDIKKIIYTPEDPQLDRLWHITIVKGTRSSCPKKRIISPTFPRPKPIKNV
jgi:hypothetical protein